MGYEWEGGLRIEFAPWSKCNYEDTWEYYAILQCPIKDNAIRREITYFP